MLTDNTLFADVACVAFESEDLNAEAAELAKTIKKNFDEVGK